MYTKFYHKKRGSRIFLECKIFAKEDCCEACHINLSSYRQMCNRPPCLRCKYLKRKENCIFHKKIRLSFKEGAGFFFYSIIHQFNDYTFYHFRLKFITALLFKAISSIELQNSFGDNVDLASRLTVTFVAYICANFLSILSVGRTAIKSFFQYNRLTYI